MIITIAEAVDWYGVYFDQKCIIQNHTLGIYEILNELCGKSVEAVVYRDVCEEWLENTGWLPENLCDVKFVN